MASSIPKTLLLVALTLLVPMGVMAGVPRPETSDWPSHIGLGGTSASGVPDPFATVTYMLRNASYVPVPLTSVIVDFSACTDIVLGPGTGVNCGAKTFMGTTDGLGRLSVTLSGHGNGAGPPRPVCDCVRVRCGGQPFPNLGVSTCD